MSSYRRMGAFANRVGRPARQPSGHGAPAVPGNDAEASAAVPPVAGMVVCAVLCVVVGGCAGGQTPVLRDAAEFRQVVLQGDKPVLVDFYKGGCPTCIALDGTIDKLAEEYKGRVIVTKFMLMQPYFAVTSPELKEQYDISFYPTVILFVNGRETWRFLRQYGLDGYRKAMDEALGAATTRRGLRP
jgi:thioredoxin 1